MSDEPEVKVYLAPGAVLPRRATPAAAGMDVCALLDSDTNIKIPPGERIAVPTGLYFEIPAGYFISLRPRSGLALKKGLTLLNTPATIDSDYRGELKVILANLGAKAVMIENGDRIAQLLLEKSQPFTWRQVESQEILEDSERGEGGFGSTGFGLA